MITSTSTKMQAVLLAEQISDEFLTCKICFEPFKDPKSLSCLHTFCEDCIEQHVNAQRSYKYTDYREFSCPICRKKTVIPTGGVRKLNDNFLVSSLSELLMTKKPSKIPFCDICKIINRREREASSKCVECQKLMCHMCCVQHQQMKITSNHNIYELEVEKDIMCKTHPDEIVRFYCEACELCVCVACTFTTHMNHDLVDFKEGTSHHKEKIEESLKKCRTKVGEIRRRLDLLKKCETRILVAQNEIQEASSVFIDSIKEKEKDLLNQINEYYGEDTLEYIKKKDDIETFLEQLKSTCDLTEVVIKGKDIEMLLLKKQICEKFSQFQDTELDALPKNIFKKIKFVKGFVNFGELKNPDDETIEGQNDEEDYYEETSYKRNGNSNETSFVDAEEEDDVEVEDEESAITHEKSTQITNRDYREIQGENIKEKEIQTDIRMIHELAPPQRDRYSRNQNNTLAMRTDSKYTQTESSNDSEIASRQILSSQSSMDDESGSNNLPVDMNKLSKRVRRYIKPGCSIAVIPVSSDIFIIDPDANSLVILDKRGKLKYISSGLQHNRENWQKLEKGVRYQTPQGILTIKLESLQEELASNKASKAFDCLPETSA